MVWKHRRFQNIPHLALTQRRPHLPLHRSRARAVAADFPTSPSLIYKISEFPEFSRIKTRIHFTHIAVFCSNRSPR